MTDRELMQQALEALQAVREAPASKDEIQRAWIVSDLLRRRLAQPEQEPVAWAGVDFAVDCTPPQRKPLTDEEIEDIWADCSVDWDDTINVLTLARAIEAAHGIKGEA